ncbi:BTAD domain-containing putative transcriptional regulator [Dactylosporangium darangshiense]|uniref:OmpR/PhoB-type domain-containing protein n=1 Tax=Dactylosporangium darangshiense TaxID=579108 RepID=A0ABP8DVH9_9ACTN
MRVAVLGPLEVVAGAGGEPVDAGTHKQRAVLAALALFRPRAVAVDALVDLLWGERPPPAPLNSLHGYIAGLRRVVEPGRAARGRPSVLVTVAPGYALRLADDDLDAARFAAAVDDAHRRLADPADLPSVPPGLGHAELAEFADRLAGALALWRGTPFIELDDAAPVVAERARLTELRLVATEDLALVRLVLGQHATVAADLGAETRQHPLRERLWALRALALARGGRQAEALDALQQIRRTLAEELGVDPGPSLRATELAVLQQDLGPVFLKEPVVLAGGTLVGRDAEVGALAGLLEEAKAGRTRFALLVGEPGIGKSRLAAEAARLAAAGGIAVLTGRCSEDEGAPPFWPWTRVLRDLAAELGADVLRELAGPDAALLPTGQPGAARGGASVEAERFEIFEAVARVLAAAAARTPLLVLLDDLHWADASSLRLLRHLTDHLGEARIAFVATRRALPEPSGMLAEAGVGLGRRHALRLDLVGLPGDAVAELARAATGRPAPAERVADLRERTGGNPFFVVELLRSAPGVPGAIGDVLARRIARLPEAARQLLRWAAVVGREFDLDALAAAAGADPDDALDDLDPALADGIVVEDAEPGRFRFSHALVRDMVYESQPATRRARRHAAIAAALQDGHPSEAARHWLAAGPSHAGAAWRAAARAAERARALHGHEEAVALLAAARAAQARDRAATAADRYDLLMAHADACQWVGDRDGQLEAIDLACAAADELGDVERLARAAVRTPDGSMWTVRDHPVVHAPAIAALRRVLRGLPSADGDLRCRALLTLAGELYYAAEDAEPLVDEGVAMAGRLGDPDLFAWAAGAAFQAGWRPDGAERRWELTGEALAQPELGGSPARREARARLLTYRAAAAQQTGRIEAMWRATAEARAEAERLRLPFPLLVVNNIETMWRAMQGRFDEVEALLVEQADISSRTLLPARRYFGFVPALVRAWQGRAGEVVAALRPVYEAAPRMAATAYLLLLLHAGNLEEAAEVVDRLPQSPDATSWSAPFDLSVTAYGAFAVSRPALAAEVYRRLAPMAGRVAVAGSAAPIGPVDAYLALAAAASGDATAAERHARDAEALMADWDIPVVAKWFSSTFGHGELRHSE